ncbi:MAG TPA: ABC transporter permease [Anaeromyxobacteraceae bacterium]|nr:ABC transporter permease [Anaeromyxobacteraceae bacterium]
MSRGGAPPDVPAAMELSREGEATLVARLTGSWRLAGALPEAALLERELDQAPAAAARIDAAGVAGWDTGLVVFVWSALESLRARGVPVTRDGFPPALERMLALVQETAHPPQPPAPARGLLVRTGRLALRARERAWDLASFVGETTQALWRFLTRRARFRGQDLGLLLDGAGPGALPIVALVNFLVGIILAFVGITQLRRFGAEYYVADIVGIAVARDMAALITAVVLAGRSGAAYAAQLATMKVTQEIDALRTLGISPTEFLVVPRLVALTLMMPFLTLFADLMGILGGAAVGTTMMNQALAAYLRQTAQSVTSGDVVGGLAKSAVYGALIALTGTARGLEAERSSERVGEAATRAVVSGVVAIIAACGIFQYVFFLFGW